MHTTWAKRESARNTKQISIILLLSCLLGTNIGYSGNPDISLVINTKNLTLNIMRGDAVIESFDNIAIGSNGATRNKLLGDEKTPTGRFIITDIRKSERFRTFIALNYPNLDHARRGRELHRIELREYKALESALEKGLPPPQNTALGGHVGIHGLGKGDRQIHDNFNWTNGCVAITNEQLEQLLGWIKTGTVVLIH